MKGLTIILTMLMSMTLVSGSYYSFGDEISWWEFDSPASNSTLAPDSAGSYNGTVNGATNGSSGYYNEAYQFDGITNTINVGDLDPNSSFSISLWAKTNDFASNFVFFGKDLINVVKGGYGLMVRTDRTLRFYYGNNTYKSPSFLYPNDGRVNGTVDDVKIFNRSLSATEAKEIYSCRTPNDGLGIWTMVANCTVTNESDTTDATFTMTTGSYTANNSSITVGGAHISNSILRVENGGIFRVAS